MCSESPELYRVAIGSRPSQGVNKGLIYRSLPRNKEPGLAQGEYPLFCFLEVMCNYVKLKIMDIAKFFCILYTDININY